MIEKIKLINFQKHKNLNVSLKQGINSIVGSSDVGKTSIIRALLNLFFNEGSLKNYLTFGENEGSIEILIDNKKIEKGISDLNYYKFEGEKFEAINKEVPKEIKNFLNLSEVNVQRQFDPPFLLGLTSGQAIKKINQYLNLDLSDYLLKIVNSEKRVIQTQIRETENVIKQNEAELKNLEGIEEINTKLTRLKKFYQNHKKKKDIYLQLKKQVSEYLILEEKKEFLKNIEKNIEKYNINKLQNEINNTKNKQELFQKLKQKINLFILLSKNLFILNKINLEKLEVKYKKILEYREELKQTEIVITKTKMYLDLIKKLNEIDKTLKICINQLPEICPLCGSKLNKKEVL